MIMPLSRMSAESSGGVFSSTLLTLSAMASRGFARASLISLEEILISLESPFSFLPVTVRELSFLEEGYALPILIFISSL